MKTNHKPVFKISAGQMFVENGKVKPNPNKGELRFSINNDNLLIMEWKDIQNNISTEPFVIFDNEWEWKKIPTQKGRVYCLESLSFPEKLFFWMQYTNISEDLMNENIISNILKSGRLEINEEKGEKKETTSMENFSKNENTSTQTNNLQNSDFIKNLAQSLKTDKSIIF
jgi:hypothetical protein